MRSTYSPNMPNRRNSKMRASREDSGVTASFIEPMLLLRTERLSCQTGAAHDLITMEAIRGVASMPGQIPQASFASFLYEARLRFVALAEDRLGDPRCELYVSS